MGGEKERGGSGVEGREGVPECPNPQLASLCMDMAAVKVKFTILH